MKGSLRLSRATLGLMSPQDAAAAAATLAEEAARMCLAFPPTGAEQLRHTAERLQSFLSQGER